MKYVSNEATLEVDFKEEKYAQIAFQVISQETCNLVSPRSKSSLKIENRKIKLDVWAKDLTSLRATLNSYLKWILIIKNMFQIIETEKDKEEDK